MQPQPQAFNWETILTIGVLVGTAGTLFFRWLVPVLRNGRDKRGSESDAFRLLHIEERLTTITLTLASIHELLDRHTIESHDEIERLKRDRQERRDEQRNK